MAREDRRRRDREGRQPRLRIARGLRPGLLPARSPQVDARRPLLLGDDDVHRRGLMKDMRAGADLEVTGENVKSSLRRQPFRELEPRETGIETALPHKLVVGARWPTIRPASKTKMRSAFFTVAEPVRDDEGGPVGCEPLDRVLHRALALGVEGRGRLVEQQPPGRSAQDGAGRWRCACFWPPESITPRSPT